MQIPPHGSAGTISLRCCRNISEPSFQAADLSFNSCIVPQVFVGASASTPVSRKLAQSIQALQLFQSDSEEADSQDATLSD
eukprot:769488-Amphidinium_carterae.1